MFSFMIPEKAGENTTFEVPEIQLIYKSKVKASLRPKVLAPKNAVDIFRKYWDADRIDLVEQFKMLLLDRAKKVTGMYEVSTGSTTQALCDPRLIFAAALKANASGIIVAHNHPSGTAEPSQADILLTSELKGAGKFLHISLVDHIILTSESYFSFADEGLL